MSRRKGDKGGSGTRAGARYGNGYAEMDPTGRYGRFDDVLGKGAMKTVYRAFDERTGKEVAWNQAKICDMLRTPDALHRMYSEVHLLSTLRHESIIRFHTSWIDVANRNFNFITEMFTSGTLREYRLRYPRVHLKAIKIWARQILDGLVYLHSHDPPVIHRDIKCDNIFVNGHLGQVKIGDLGLAAVLKGSQSAHSVIGTPEFMAPELYEEDYNELVDIYSFGMCMLEMLTSEYPYSECCNPAQIYKKVTSGKLPDAFNRIKDPEMKRFIGRCLVSASKRSSAKELLDDPFLSLDDDTVISPRPVVVTGKNPITQPRSHGTVQKEDEDELEPEAEPDSEPENVVEKTAMTITGKLNPDDDTIFLKVQIADKDGHSRNIYFPFDILSDTPIDVAHEMVKDLEITDWESSEIAKMISQEISQLVPDWKFDCNSEPEEYSYGDGDDDGDDRDGTHPFYCASPTASSHGSLYGFDRSSSSKGLSFHAWQDELYTDDDDSSIHSGKYSAIIYSSGNEAEADSSPRHRETQAQSISHKSIRFGENPRDSHLASKLHKHSHILPDASTQGAGTSRGRQPTVDKRRMLRNRSMVDIRSQLLHRTLVDELNKRLFKTIGSVENIGFQDPYQNSSSSQNRGSPSRDERKKGKRWF
ncbi:hypothetical protein LUZ62_020024 [Rhynchospora pubera]|uniref:non-specific serine/threonine protein kinase n=1 Tax=Rhynchospora pubera TaxID=906938 RepID=A0AAV8GWR0_9POAL|nr:hypothetical protein LUZ62_020024 [Rhynchospora pubera]